MTDKSADTVVAQLQVHVSDGLSQAVRQLPALQKDYFNVDERRFDQLLAQVQDYARLVKMPGMDHKNISAANQLFADDEVVVMAYILAQDINLLDRQFELRMQQELANSNWPLQDVEGASPLGLARLLDSWLLLLRYPQTAAGEQLYSMIESVIISFGKDFYPLLMKFPALQELAPTLFSPQFLELTKQEQLRLEALGMDLTATLAPPAAAMDEDDLRSIYAALVKSIDMVQSAARTLLPDSLTGEYHDPAAAIRIVFVLLYRKLQDKLNRFTLEYFDFYFNRVLQVKLLPMRPDSVHIVLQPNGTQSQTLPRGTEFFAGLDVNRQDIIYRSDADVEINDAKVEQIHSVYFPRHQRFDDPERHLIDGCWHTAVPTDNAGPEIYPLFGEQRGQIRTESVQDARLGFSIASNVLLMREGKRKVNLQLHYLNLINDSCATLEHQINDMPALKASKADRNTRAKAKFFAYFGNIFSLAITTAEGWYDIPEYKPAYHGTDSSLKRNCLGISFSLPEDCPPITPFMRDVHGTHLQSAAVPTAVPVLRFLLKDNYLQYPYDVLRKLALREIRIAVEVEGCRDLLLYNNLGQLSPLAPFMPFGPLPGVGSYFIVGHEETRNKQLNAH
jgi:hypothetical protein